MPPRQTLHLHLFLLALLSLSLLFSRTRSAIIETKSPSDICPSYVCGGVHIKYPFWYNGSSTPNPHCGYPSFGLSCSDDNKTTLKVPTDTYNVTGINYETKTLSLIDADVLTGNAICPRAKHNVTLTSAPQLRSSDSTKNLTFFFDCSTHFFLYLSSDYPSVLVSTKYTNLSCLASGGNQTLVFETDKIPEGLDWHRDCEAKVVTTVMEEAITNVFSRTDGFAGALRNGFELDWGGIGDCVGCEESGGYCAYSSNSTTDFFCFCEDGKRSRDRCSGGNNWKVPVIATSAALAFLGAGLLILFLIYRGHKKRKFAAIRSKDISVSSTPFSRNFSSDPSSTTTDLEKASTYFGVPIFSYDELEEATNNFDSTKELGDGGFGTVYHGKLRDGRVVAVKRLYENNYKRVEQFMNEVEILTRLRHQNLVTLYGCTSRRSRELILVYEYIPNGTVADHLHGDRAKAGGLPWSIRMSISIETASALSYLHASDIIHRDVKTNNILLDNNFGVKVADFGLSRLFPTDVTHVSTAPQGTPGYVDPEYHQCYQLTDKSDVYSFGVVLIELISSKPAVDITRHRHEINLANMAINRIQNRTLHELIDPCLNFESDHRVRRMATAVAELAFRCLQFEREMRPTMDEVLEVLNGIQSEEDGMVAKTEEADIPSDDVGLLKKGLSPPSPDSVVNYVWESQKTTPNTSS